MKHTLLATTALVAMTGAASAELSISATGRIGLSTTEGNAVVTEVRSYNKTTANTAATYNLFGLLTTAFTPVSHKYNITATNQTAAAAGGLFTVTDVTDLDNMIVEANNRLNGISDVVAATTLLTAKLVDTAAERTQIDTDIATMKSIRAQMFSISTAAKAVAKDSTDSENRMRVTFKGSGETDAGISYGATIRADNSGAGSGGTGGSQYVSGVFGKVSMGDLNGADETGAGGGVSGVGLTGLGDKSDIKYQSSDHNIAYQYSTAGITFGYSQNTAVKAGSNSAMGIKWAGDLGGSTVTVGIGQSKVGTSTQSSLGLTMSTGGLTLKAITSNNDNGPAVVSSAGTARSATGTTAYVADTVAANNYDTDHTAVSISYAMDAMSVTAFTKTVSTKGVKDEDYSGMGFTYDMGGVTLKAGVVDNDDQQLVDFGLSFSF